MVLNQLFDWENPLIVADCCQSYSSAVFLHYFNCCLQSICVSLCQNWLRSRPQWGDRMTCIGSELAQLIILLHCKHSGAVCDGGCFSRPFTTLQWAFVWAVWFTGDRVVRQEGTRYPRGSVLVSCQRWMNRSRWAWAFPPVSAAPMPGGQRGPRGRVLLLSTEEELPW